MKQSLVSVIIPVYNAEAFIGKTLESVVTQTYGNLEILVINDGSCDCTVEIVERFAQQDHRIRLLNQSNGGVAAARNLGIQKAQGEFIAPIDADDLWYPNAIEKMANRYQVSPSSTGVVYTWSIDIDHMDQFTGGFHAASVRGNVYKTLICHNFLGNASATLIRKSSLDTVGGYSTELKAKDAQGCEDWELYLRLAERYRFEAVSEFLVGYRKVACSMSSDFSQMARSQLLMLQGVKERNPEIPNFLYRLSRSSFYLYLAQQCETSGNARASLLWLWQAVKVDPITPVGRLGLYSLVVKNVLKKLLDKFSRLAQVELVAASVASEPSLVEITAPALAAQPTISRFKIGIKVWVGLCLHQVLSQL